MNDFIIRTTALTDTADGVIADVTVADNADLDAAMETIRFRVIVKCERWWAVAAIQRAALQRIRDVIGDEIQRTGHIVNQRPD